MVFTVATGYFLCELRTELLRVYNLHGVDLFVELYINKNGNIRMM